MSNTRPTSRQFFTEDYAKNSDLYREFTVDGNFDAIKDNPGFQVFLRERYKNSRVSVPKTKEEAEPIQNIIKTVKETHNNRYSSLIIEGINERFSWALYGDFRVIMMNSNGYINATKLCQLGGKEFKHWNETKQASELIEEVKKYINNPIILIKNNNKQKVWGTYVHPELLKHIFYWVMPTGQYIEKNISNSGYIYIIGFFGNCKIGKSRKIEGLKKYLRGRYITAYGFTDLDESNFRCFYSEDVDIDEARIHNKYSEYRYNNSEIFTISFDKIEF